MIQVSVNEASHRLGELLAAVNVGKGIEIRDEHGQGFRLVPLGARPPTTGTPKAGSCLGLIEMRRDFDAPLDEMREYMQ